VYGFVITLGGQRNLDRAPGIGKLPISCTYLRWLLGRQDLAREADCHATQLDHLFGADIGRGCANAEGKGARPDYRRIRGS
jgi:hypothetical protein